MRLLTLAAAVSLSFIVFAVTASAQEPSDVYKVDYFDNAQTTGAPDATLRLSNPGTAGPHICANIYVFNTDEELQQCCACSLVANGLRKLSVNNDLTANPLTRVTFHTGTVAIVSVPQTGQYCGLPYKGSPVQALRAWATHVQDQSFTLTESPSQDAILSPGELNELQRQCYAFWLDSNSVPCTCGTGN